MFLMKSWKKSQALVLLALFANNELPPVVANAKIPEKTTVSAVRTYMNFAKEIDPANILTMADLELSIALSTTLVVFNSERQIVGGLAEKWTILPPYKIAITIRRGLKWSDGSAVKAREYRTALERAKKMYGNDLKALFDSVANIEAPDDHTLVFTTNGDVAKSGILLKLTEPMYGLVALHGDKPDLSKTVGPFFVKRKSSTELTLAVNTNWYEYAKDIPQSVEIRRPKEGVDLLASFESDAWPNLTSGSSLMSKEALEHLRKNGYKTWQRSLDKVYSLYPSKRFLNAGGADLIKNLALKINTEVLMNGLTGYAETTQFFPRGYELFSQSHPKIDQVGPWKSKAPVVVMLPDTQILPVMRDRIAALTDLEGANVKIEVIPMSTLDERMKCGDFDILAASIAVADPNFEGAMSFFIERVPPAIQSTPGKNDFAGQLRVARSLPTSQERAVRMREIIIRAQEAGYVLPLFHFSSLAIAKPGLDLSEIPNSDETILFSKVRMR